MSNQQESNLYVKHIPLSWTDEDLYDFYKSFGEIISVKVITVGVVRTSIVNNRMIAHQIMICQWDHQEVMVLFLLKAH